MDRADIFGNAGMGNGSLSGQHAETAYICNDGVASSKFSQNITSPYPIKIRGHFENT